MSERVLIDGEGVSVRSRQSFRFRCCDCGLTHLVALVSGKGGWIGLAVKRDKLATRNARRRLGVKVCS